jgi:deoxyribodipyrimidine photo-lyase
MSQKRAIVWFKTDLRLTDNETVSKALAHSDWILPVFFIDPNQFMQNELGIRKTGFFRAKFLLESLQDLDQQLREKSSGLLVIEGKAEVELPRLVKEYGVTKVFCKQEVAPEELLELTTVEQQLWKLGCTVESFSTSTLYHAVDLPFTLREIPEVFTKFRKRIEKECIVRDVLPEIGKLSSPVIPPFQPFDLTKWKFEERRPDQRSSFPFKGGETSGHERISSYFFEQKGLFTYKETRNGLNGTNYSSKLSPWLALGCVSPRFVYAKIKDAEQAFGANESSYWLYFELLWREYFRFMMKKHKHLVFSETGYNGLKNNQKTSPNQEENFHQWKHGDTDDSFVNAFMKELNATGYMSNRGRQNVASYLIDHLQVDWRLGAAYFEEQLIDYDVSSNWGNWAYLAGVGSDPRGKRVFDTQKQASNYDPKKAFQEIWKTI